MAVCKNSSLCLGFWDPCICKKGFYGLDNCTVGIGFGGSLYMKKRVIRVRKFLVGII